MRRALSLALLVSILVACGGEEPTGGPQPGAQPGSSPDSGDIVPLTPGARKQPIMEEPVAPPKPADPELALMKSANRLLDSEDAEQRLLAIEKLTGARDGKEAGRLIVKLLFDPDEDVRIVAVEAVGQIEYRAGADALRAVLDRDEESTVRKQALLSLYALVSKEAVPDLVQALDDDDQNVRAAAVTLLGDSGSPKGVEPLISLVSGDDYDFSEQVRMAAVAALGKLEAKEAADAVIEALQDANVLVRTESAKVLGILGDKKAVPGLIRLVDPEESPDESSRVIEHAVKSLSKLTGEKIVFSLDHSLEAQDAARKAWMDWWEEHKEEYD